MVCSGLENPACASRVRLGVSGPSISDVSPTTLITIRGRRASLVIAGMVPGNDVFRSGSVSVSAKIRQWAEYSGGRKVRESLTESGLCLKSRRSADIVSVRRFDFRVSGQERVGICGNFWESGSSCHPERAKTQKPGRWCSDRALSVVARGGGRKTCVIIGLSKNGSRESQVSVLSFVDHQADDFETDARTAKLCGSDLSRF